MPRPHNPPAPTEPVVELPELWPHQQEFVDDPVQFSVCKSATKCGKTTACAWWLAREALLTPGALFWWVGPTNEVGLIGYKTVMHLLASEIVKQQERPWKFRVSNGASVALKTAQEPAFCATERKSTSTLGRCRETNGPSTTRVT